VTKAEPTVLDIAHATLLAPAGVDPLATERVFGTILAHKADEADLYFQYNRSEGWTLEEGEVKNASYSIDQGVGVRVVSGEKTAFAYSDDITVDALDSAARVTRAIAADGGDRRVATQVVRAGLGLYAPIDPVAQFDDARKVKILEALERFARAVDPRVKQVIGRLSGEYDVVMVARADGGTAADVRPLVHLAVTVIAEQDGRREQGHQGAGGRFGYDFFTDERLEKIADDAVRQALLNLESRPAPAGPMSVVLGPGWPGILLHEAMGH
jgi:TldD protein